MNPMRWHISCPDCGYIETEEQSQRRHVLNGGSGAFDCPRCGAHYSAEDFETEMEQKHMGQHHNHAKADLSGEEA